MRASVFRVVYSYICSYVPCNVTIGFYTSGVTNAIFNNGCTSYTSSTMNIGRNFITFRVYGFGYFTMRGFNLGKIGLMGTFQQGSRPTATRGVLGVALTMRRFLVIARCGINTMKICVLRGNYSFKGLFRGHFCGVIF